MFSTPKNRDMDLRRQSLMNVTNTVAVHSPLRRNTNPHLNPVVLLEQCPTKDDELERSKRRNVVDIQKRLSNINTSSPFSEINKFGEREMKEHFQICTKLYMENKINQKNVWQLQIIDVLKLIVKANKNDAMQIASSSLDIGAKVYGLRVDDIHSDGLKLVNNMARVDKQNSDESTVNDGESMPESETNKKTRGKKQRKFMSHGPKNTIAKNANSLLGPLPKLESVFFSAREDPQSSATENLFTNMLPMHPAGHQFYSLFRNEDNFWISDKDEDPTIENVKTYPFEMPEIKDWAICAPFNNFTIDHWDQNEEENEVNRSLIKENEVVYDNDGIPLPELDSSIHNIFENDDNNGMINSDEDEEEQQQQNQQNELINISETPLDNIQKTDYSYNQLVQMHNGRIIDRLWAGPSHWKVKFIRPSMVRYSGTQCNNVVAQQNSKRNYRKKIVGPIDFEKRPINQFDYNNKLGKKRNPPTTLFDNTVLPFISKSDIEEFFSRSFMSKNSVAPQKLPKTKDGDELNVSLYKYNNPTDMEYCSQHGSDEPRQDDDNGLDNDDNSIEQEENVVAAQNFIGENLVKAPMEIPKAFMPFATQSKNMDMKNLKKAVWNTIMKPGEKIDITFLEMYKQLPNLLNDEMQKNLSHHLAIVALLHLCNEENLELVQFPDYDNCHIKKAEE